MALPTNSILFIRGEVWGIRRFNANPAKNALVIASIPANSAYTAPQIYHHQYQYVLSDIIVKWLKIPSINDGKEQHDNHCKDYNGYG